MNRRASIRQACLRPRDRFWDIPVPKIDSAFDNLLVPQQCRVPCDYITGSRKTWRKHNAMVIHPQARTTPKLRAEIKAQRDRKQVDL
ncbi:hypothetical protein, partial [Thiolapillus sp.]|uniref:hypothetical protein n=1 Tax=Thiolapillus sp. TaxID=2017437 RepID=UPI003AF4CD2A